MYMPELSHRPLPMKRKVQKRRQAIIVTGHLWKHNRELGRFWWNEDRTIDSRAPGSSRRGSRSLPARCGPAKYIVKRGNHFVTQISARFFQINTSVRMFLVAITLKMVYHFFSTILSHLYRDLWEHGSQKLKCSRKPISSRILLGASLSGYQFLQVSDCVVLVAFNPHLGIILYDLLTFFLLQVN